MTHRTHLTPREADILCSADEVTRDAIDALNAELARVCAICTTCIRRIWSWRSTVTIWRAASWPSSRVGSPSRGCWRPRG